jgi:hypothetical protein
MNGSAQPGLMTQINTWFAAPFNAQGSVLQWAAFVGIIAIAAFLWSRIINDFAAEI